MAVIENIPALLYANECFFSLSILLYKIDTHEIFYDISYDYFIDIKVITFRTITLSTKGNKSI